MVSTANIVIRNNKIDSGAWVSSGVPTLSRYEHCAWIRGDAIIDGNTFAHPSANADMLNITDGNCLITNNKFIRGDTTINSYIRHHSTSHLGTHQITENYFDQANIDGYTEVLVKGLNIGTLYTRNRNQIGFIYLPIFDNSYASLSSTYGPVYATNTYSTLNSPDGNIFYITREDNLDRATLITAFYSDASATDPVLAFRRSFNLGYFLEKGMTFMDVRIGGKGLTGTKTSFSNDDSEYFGVRVKFHNPATSMTLSNYDAVTPFFIDYMYPFNATGDYTSFMASTVYNNTGSGALGASDGNYSGFIRPDAFTIGNGYHIEVEFKLQIEYDTSSYGLLFTPIEIKYKW